LINLGGNAIKFTNQGEVVVTVQRCESRHAGLCNLLEFSVRDSGIGIAPETSKSIFLAAFSQAESNTTLPVWWHGTGPFDFPATGQLDGWRPPTRQCSGQRQYVPFPDPIPAV
jgi:hypothetical protein